MDWGYSRKDIPCEFLGICTLVYVIKDFVDRRSAPKQGGGVESCATEIIVSGSNSGRCEEGSSEYQGGGKNIHNTVKTGRAGETSNRF